ncbi:hypothetical protein D9M71_771930 [compost metagenome]
MLVDDIAVGIYQIQRRPVLVAPGIPGGVHVVLRHRVADIEALERGLDIGGGLFEAELGRMHADHHQPLVAVFVVPLAHMGQGADAVDAVVSPEIDQHNLAAQSGKGQRFGV